MSCNRFCRDRRESRRVLLPRWRQTEALSRFGTSSLLLFLISDIYVYFADISLMLQGMGSIEAMAKGSEKRYFASGSAVKVAQGVSGSVTDKGSLKKYLPYIRDNIRRGLEEVGASSLTELREMNSAGELRFELRSSAAQREGGVHSLYGMK